MSLNWPRDLVLRGGLGPSALSAREQKIVCFKTLKMKDLLREKCRIRTRGARQSCFQHSRIEDITKEEWKKLYMELMEVHRGMEMFMHEIYNDLKYNWFIEDQLELEEQNEIYLINMAENNEVLCPVCQKRFLKRQDATIGSNQLYRCVCNASFSYAGDKQRLRSELNEVIDLHEQGCLSRLTFFVACQRWGKRKRRKNNSDTIRLNAMCGKCNYFSTLV